VTTSHGRSNGAIVEGDDDLVAFGSGSDTDDGHATVVGTVQLAKTDEFDRGSNAATFPCEGEETTGSVSSTTVAIFVTCSSGHRGARRGITVFRARSGGFTRGAFAVSADVGFALFFSTVATVKVDAAKVSTPDLSSTVTVTVADPCFGPAFAGAVTVFDFTSCAVTLVGVAELVGVFNAHDVPLSEAACIVDFADGRTAGFVVAACGAVFCEAVSCSGVATVLVFTTARESFAATTSECAASGFTIGRKEL